MGVAIADPRYFRIRIKFDADEELTREAWERDEVGIWYGAWDERDLKAALRSEDPVKELTEVNKKRGLNWEFVPAYVNTARRFASIDPQDWVVVYFDGSLGLAHVCTDVMSSREHPLNREGQLFKHRNINGKKLFSLNLLPDAFRVLSFAGRGNVYEPRGGAGLARLLGEARTESDVTKALKLKSLDEALDLLGPTSWESVCQAYLTIEHQFVPTGLATGNTLPGVDIVGRRSTDGTRILAQCKKDPEPECITDEFIQAIADLGQSDMAFYFAYGGCAGEIPSRVQVVDRDAIREWSRTNKGAQYFQWLFGG